MTWVWLNSIGLTPSIGVDQSRAHEIRVWNRVRVCNAQGVFVDCLDWAPDVDDLESLLDELIRFIGEVVVNALSRGWI